MLSHRKVLLCFDVNRENEINRRVVNKVANQSEKLGNRDRQLSWTSTKSSANYQTHPIMASLIHSYAFAPVAHYDDFYCIICCTARRVSP
jgi:hypothetical protein